MITINGERGFEQVESWEQILELPGFTAELNPEQKQLKAIIGRYVFKERIPCGLCTCRQPHGKGYIVTTETGEITNIGNRCGKTHFGVKFDEFSKVFTQAITDHQHREAIASFLFRLEGYSMEVATIRSETQGADWVYKVSRALVERNRGCPDVLVTEVNKMLRSRSGDIRVARIASEAEAEELDAISGKKSPRPQYIEEIKGRLKGITALYKENDLREMLVLDVEPKLKELADFDVDQATSHDLRYWAKWCQELDDKIERVRDTVRTGRVLLDRGNLAQLADLISDPRDTVMFRKWLATAASK